MAEITCAHCGRRYPRMEGMVGNQPLCHPDDPRLPDCYRLVTVYHEPIGARLEEDMTLRALLAKAQEQP